MDTVSAPQSGYQDQIEEANKYLDKHKIPQILEGITQALVFERPSNPNEFIIKKLEALVAARDRGQKSILSDFTKENIISVFRILDVTSVGHISVEKYSQGMKAFGLEYFNDKPAGFDTNKIILDTFVTEVYSCHLTVRNKAINKK